MSRETDRNDVRGHVTRSYVPCRNVAGERILHIQGFLAVAFLKNAVHGHGVHGYNCSCDFEGSYAQSRCVDEVHWGCKYHGLNPNRLKVMQGAVLKASIMAGMSSEGNSSSHVDFFGEAS